MEFPVRLPSQLSLPLIATCALADAGSKKKAKKQKKQRDEVDKGFMEAQAAADLATRRANQTATLDALFELLFRWGGARCSIIGPAAVVP